MQIQIKITATVVTSRYGTLMSGDILRTDSEFASHLVGECKAAEYVAPTAQDPEKRTSKAAPKNKSE